MWLVPPLAVINDNDGLLGSVIVVILHTEPFEV